MLVAWGRTTLKRIPNPEVSIDQVGQLGAGWGGGKEGGRPGSEPMGVGQRVALRPCALNPGSLPHPTRSDPANTNVYIGKIAPDGLEADISAHFASERLLQGGTGVASRTFDGVRDAGAADARSCPPSYPSPAHPRTSPTLPPSHSPT